MTLNSRSLMWVMMVRCKTSDQYLTSDKVSTWFIRGFKWYRLLKTLTKSFNILSNAVANADAVATAIALPVLSYRYFCTAELTSDRRTNKRTDNPKAICPFKVGGIKTALDHRLSTVLSSLNEHWQDYCRCNMNFLFRWAPLVVSVK